MIKVTLNGMGGELDHRVCFDSEDDIRAAVHDLLRDCVLAAGDTITFEEVDSEPR